MGLLWLVIAFLVCEISIADDFANIDVADSTDWSDFADVLAGTSVSALTRVVVKARVGVLMDEFPSEKQDNFKSYLLDLDDFFWQGRGEMQIDLTSYRLTYRQYYSSGFQLVLPDKDQWSWEWEGIPFYEVWQGHKLVSRRYTMTTYILSTNRSISRSEPILAAIGGEWREPFRLPVDPFLLYQRTGLACVNEGQYPPNTADPEKMEFIFDDTCKNGSSTLGSLGCDGCHCTQPIPTQNCRAALRDSVGFIDVDIQYTRVPFNETIAARYREQMPLKDGADLTPSKNDLKDTRIVYRYFPNPTCERAPDEMCVGNFGWRRLLYFDAVDKNAGSRNLNMGTKDFILEALTHDPPTQEIAYGLYEYSSCHKHYHFKHFGNFSFLGATSSATSKRGFCVASVNRWANAEWAPTWSRFSTCERQGINAGWSDVYQAGISCQHIDITDVTSSSGSLRSHTNFDGLLCEGTLVKFPNGTQQYELTSFTTASGAPVSKQKCNSIPNPDGNNVKQLSIDLPLPGDSYVTRSCNQDGQHFGPLRNCEFQKVTPEIRSCVAGSSKTINCRVDGNPNDMQVVRVCEASRKLNVGTACRHQDALQNVIIGTTNTPITFTCPSARDSFETGGRYSLYTAELRGKNPEPIICS